MQAASGDDLDRLIDHIGGGLPADWTAWPGGWPGQIELALIDAVLSIRTRYGSPDTGVRMRVGRYRDHPAPHPCDDLDALSRWDPEELASLLKTRQRTAGDLKAAAIVNAATQLVGVGVRHAADLDPVSPEQRAAYCGVHGLGPVTWRYLLMLVGRPGVKADTWICRFVAEAIGRPVHAAAAETLVTQAAGRLGVSSTDLDHAIWSHLSRQAPIEEPAVVAQPMISVTEVQAASRWYQTVLGAHSGHGGPDYEQLLADGQMVLQLHRAEVAHHHGTIGDPTEPTGNGVALWFEVAHFDAAVDRARELGASVETDVHLNPNAGHREIWLRDLDGYLVVLADSER